MVYVGNKHKVDAANKLHASQSQNIYSMSQNVKIGDIFGEFRSGFVENYDILRLMKVSNGDNSNCNYEFEKGS